MYFLVFQSFIETEKFNTETMSNDISLFTAVRKVEASSIEQAIGKFMLDTAGLKFTKRIDPLTCFEFDSLRTI